MTAEEFEAMYAKKSGISIQWLRDAGLRPLACACGEPECSGWAMVHDDLVNYHMRLYAPQEKS